MRRSGYADGTSSYNYDIAANRNGTQFAPPGFNGMSIYNAAFAKVATLGRYSSGPIGVAYHPTRDLIDDRSDRLYTVSEGSVIRSL